MFELNTSRLHLRPPVAEDFEAYAQICADPKVMKYLGGPMDRLAAWRHLATLVGHWHLRGYGVFAVLDKTTGELLGRVGYIHPEGYPGFEVGWTLARSAWGRGYATEAAGACIDHAFSSMGRDEVISLIEPGNAASEKVAQRMGQQRGKMTKIMDFDVNIWRVTREQWLQRQ